MPREFSSNEAKELISFYNALLNSAHRISDYRERNIADINSQIDSIAGRNACGPAILAFLNRHEETDDRNATTEKLIRTLYIEKVLNARLIQWSLSDNQYTNDIRKAVQDLNAGTGTFKWLFSSGDVKRRAEQAYFYLVKVKGTTYEADVSKALDYAHNALNESKQIDRVWQDFLSNKNDYKRVLQGVRNGAPVPGNAIDQCAEVTWKYNQIFKAYTELEARIETNKKAVRRAADYVRTEETKRMLEGIPVEQLNRGHNGIKVKTLRDAGYETIADISSATVYDIYNIYGISYDMASNIKEMVSDMYDSSYESSKVRLAYDQQTTASTKLVQELYKLRPYHKELKQLESEYERATRNMGEGLADAVQINGGFRWLFYTTQEKENIYRAYQLLSGFLEDDWAERINRLIDANIQSGVADPDEAWSDFKENTVSYYTILEDIIPDLIGSGDKNYGLPEDLAREIEEEEFFPDGLKAELRPYQVWGVKFTLHQGKVLLGDEMGLGKTVQAIATMVSLRNTGAKHFMVVCPASVLVNWEKEVSRFSKLRAFKIHGAGKSRTLKEWQRIGGVAITTYETTGSINLPDDLELNLLVVDEAHYIKNPSARRSQNVEYLAEQADRILLMTGTALENKVDEMINLVRVINPDKANELNNIAFMSTAPQFRESVAPVYFRRKREMVLNELPDLIEEEQWIGLSPVEFDKYRHALYSKKYADIRRVSWNVDNPRKSSKGQRLIELVNEATEEGRNVLVFSFFLDTIKAVRQLIGSKYYGYINGSVSPVKRQEIIDGFSEQSGKVLLAQVQAGGTGLNIQAASVVIFCEPQLKPSLEDQAISRAYRMGQSASNVLVYRLLCEDSIDERIMDLLAEKRRIFEEFADKSTSGDRMVEIDDKSFNKLIQEEIDRINSQGYRPDNPEPPVDPDVPDPNGPNMPPHPEPPHPGPDTGGTKNPPKVTDKNDSTLDQLYKDLINSKLTVYKDNKNNRLYVLYTPSTSSKMRPIIERYGYEDLYRNIDVSPVLGERSFIIYKKSDSLNTLTRISKAEMRSYKSIGPKDDELILQMDFTDIDRFEVYAEKNDRWRFRLPSNKAYDLYSLRDINIAIIRYEDEIIKCNVDCEVHTEKDKYDMLCTVQKRIAILSDDPYILFCKPVVRFTMSDSSRLTIIKGT